MASLIIECAFDATYASTSALLHPNESALKAAVAMIYVYVVFYEICLDGAQFAYPGEMSQRILERKGSRLGLTEIGLMNIIWLQGECFTLMKRLEVMLIRTQRHQQLLRTSTGRSTCALSYRDVLV